MLLSGPSLRVSMHTNFIGSVVAIVPDLTGQASHYYFYHLKMAEAAQRISLRYHVMASVDCSISPLPKGWQPCLEPQASASGKNSWLSKLMQKRASRVSLSEGLRAHLSTCPNLCLFLEVSTDRVLRQLARAVLSPSCRPKHVLLMVREAPDTTYSRGRRIRLWIQTLKYLLPSKALRICVDTEPLADAWEPTLGYRPEVFPVLALSADSTPLPQQREDGKLRLWWPGHPSARKGLSWVQRLAANRSQEARQLQIVCSEWADLPSGGLAELVRLPAELDRAAYQAQLDACDAILLPYTRDRYQMSSSGIFVEGIHAGKPVFTCADTWMARELHRFNLDAFAVDWSRADLPQLFSDLCADHDKRKKLSEMQTAYRRFHSIDRLAECLRACVAA